VPYATNLAKGLYAPHQTVRNTVTIKSKLYTIQTLWSSCVL